MNLKKITIFGGSGNIGCSLIRKLTKNNFKVTVVTRNLHQKGYVLKTQGNPGYLDIVESSVIDESKIRTLINDTDICINLVGILYEKGQFNTFKNIHEKFPTLLSNLCNEYHVKQFIHLSALGIDEPNDSSYALSKLNGENFIKEHFKEATILRPSVVYSANDNFTTRFMTLLNILPIFPLYYKGSTMFKPIHVSDLTEIIYQVIVQNIKTITIECVGSEEISLKDILQRLLKLIDKKRLLIPIPLVVAKILAIFFQLFPKPLLTLDQLRLLKYQNIPSGKFKTNFDLKIPSYSNFDTEVKKYCYMWREAGQFSQTKYKDD